MARPSESASLVLRLATRDDFETLYAIDQACYAPEIAYSRRELRWYLRQPGVECLVADAEGQIAGFLVAARQGARAHIITLDVLEPSRRRGIGSALLVEMERRLAAQGAQQVELETATNNDPAVAFWQKHGYRTAGVLRGYYPGPIDAYAMYKSFSAVPHRGEATAGEAH